MSKLWWQLPGPNRFLERIRESLRNGENVLVFFPLFIPGGFKESLRDILVGGYRQFEEYEPRSNTTSTVAPELIKYYLPETDPAERWGANTLTQSDEFCGRTIWIKIDEDSQWKRWRSFITDYAHACRHRDSFDRSVFLIVLCGISPPVPASIEDVFLRQFTWNACIDYFDILLYAAEKTIGHSDSELQRKLRCSLISHLALWDATMVEILADLSLRKLHQPQDIFLDICKQRGWENEEISSFQWEYGLINRFRNESEAIHSAVLVAHDDWELNDRIWRAQIGVVFPFIEGQRRNFIKRYGNRLKIPHQRKETDDVVYNVFDLEFGDIAYQFRKHVVNETGMNPQMPDLVSRMATSRNELAHMRPLPFDSLPLPISF
jgi:hypothetical protein